MAEDSTTTFGANQARPSGERNNENQHSTTECDDENACCASSSRRDCAWCGPRKDRYRYPQAQTMRSVPNNVLLQQELPEETLEGRGAQTELCCTADRKASVALGVAQAAEKAKGIAGGDSPICGS